MADGLCGFSEDPFEDLREYQRALNYAEKRFAKAQGKKIFKEFEIADALNMHYSEWDEYGCSFCKIERKYGTVVIYSSNSGAFASLLSDLELQKDILIYGNPRKRIKPQASKFFEYEPIKAKVGEDYYKIEVQHEVLRDIVLMGLADSCDVIRENKNDYELYHCLECDLIRDMIDEPVDCLKYKGVSNGN